MSRPVIIIIAALALAAIFGWLSAGSSDADNREIRDPWPDSLAATDKMSINDARERLNGSALFPKPKAKTGPNGEELGPDGKPLNGGAKAAEQNSTPLFPDIRGVSILDGRPHVTLELANGDVKTVAQGQTLPSGWQLKSVDPVRIIATYKDEEITRPIRDYAPEGY